MTIMMAAHKASVSTYTAACYSNGRIQPIPLRNHPSIIPKALITNHFGTHGSLREHMGTHVLLADLSFDPRLSAFIRAHFFRSENNDQTI